MIKTIIDKLAKYEFSLAKMERKLDLLETCSSRSQETYPYFVEDNLEQNNFHCWYRVSLINTEKKNSYTRLKMLRITTARVNSANCIFALPRANRHIQRVMHSVNID